MNIQWHNRASALLVGALVLSGCAGTSVASSPGTPDPNVSSSVEHLGAVGTETPTDETIGEESSPAPSMQTTKAAVGDTVVLPSGDPEADGTMLDVTLVSVLQKARPKDEYNVPEPGSRFVAVRLRITNKGPGVYDDSPGNGITIADAEGQRFTETSNETAAGVSMPGGVTLSPGSSVIGWIAFQVPKTAKVVLVQYNADSGFGQTTAEWIVK